VAWAGSAGVTKVTIRPPNSKVGFHGRLFSHKGKICTIGRTVIVLRQRGPIERPKTDPQVGTTTSVKKKHVGYWSLSAASSPHSGFYYAEATKTSDCRAGFSTAIKVTPHERS
jgi:hypothetical protein